LTNAGINDGRTINKFFLCKLWHAYKQESSPKHSAELSTGYKRDDVPELDLSYTITIHKTQGSEFGAVIMPVLTQHFKRLFRNLIYTGLTRARKLAVLVGTRKALAMAVKNQDASQRQTYLKELLRSESVSI
jgi:ATP-dependent exoDNAse (exonuclease V) alpha subunit